MINSMNGETLANLKSDQKTILKVLRPNASVGSLALWFVGSLDGVIRILSRLSTQCQIQDNLNHFLNFELLTEAEHRTIW